MRVQSDYEHMSRSMDMPDSRAGSGVPTHRGLASYDHCTFLIYSTRVG